MKIEVGDIVNTTYSRNVEVLDVRPGACNKSEYRVWFINDFGDRTNTLIENCTLVKKGEKKMEEVKFNAIEAYKLMKKGSIMKNKDGYLYKIVDGSLFSKLTKQAMFTKSLVLVDKFFNETFTEYKEPLKYKVGDKVWVEAEITRVEPDAEYPYTVARRPYAKEEDVKGIDE